ncbi:protein fuzzy homolog [Lineus longissimus]|uniref:protein fuzzy homolog n=1 Tax=Lineus longissimus TaxID=88925 RepID=UPI002B4EA90F
MAAYLLCLTEEGGVPIFTKTKGDLKLLPFPVIGSMNGVHMFASNHGVSLVTTTTEDSKVAWKVFHDSIKLILVSHDDQANDKYYLQCLDLLFNGMVLLCGLEELTKIRNVERLKKEIKVSLPLAETLLEQADLPLICDLTGCVDMVATSESATLQNCIDAFAESAESPYGCLFVYGKVVVATKKWWNLTSMEQILLSLLIHTLPKCSCRDLVVYLPDTSPKVPHRLLMFQLVQGVEACVICGPKPSLAELQRDVSRFWRTVFEPLKTLTWSHPRNFPTSIVLDKNILGFLLVNSESKRCLYSVHIQQEAEPNTGRRHCKTLPPKQCREILRSFYKSVCGTLFTTLSSPKIIPASAQDQDHQISSLNHATHGTYLVSPTHKCYALKNKTIQLYVLFSSSIPTYAMRSVSNKTLGALTKDKTMQL